MESTPYNEDLCRDIETVTIDNHSTDCICRLRKDHDGDHSNGRTSWPQRMNDTDLHS